MDNNHGVLSSTKTQDDDNTMNTETSSSNSAIDNIHAQLKEITSSISNHQKLIEQKGHTDRADSDCIQCCSLWYKRMPQQHSKI